MGKSEGQVKGKSIGAQIAAMGVSGALLLVAALPSGSSLLFLSWSLADAANLSLYVSIKLYKLTITYSRNEMDVVIFT